MLPAMSSKRYPIPAGEVRIELHVKNSRFIGRAGYTPNVAEAKAFIEKVKAEEPGCTHAVYAFAIGHGAAVTHGMSDAGEPSGTAGRPALAVVKGSGLGDVTVVIVRYFGGTKLGTGGLVKAYTETAQAVLAALPVTERSNDAQSRSRFLIPFMSRSSGWLRLIKARLRQRSLPQM